MENQTLHGLNNNQIEAVRIIDGPVLVISGPGSGKTRCLTHRVAYLIQQGIPSQNILAITFTNKASEEMRERIFNLLEVRPQSIYRGPTSLDGSKTPTIGTFHSIGLRILRNEIPQLGYRRNFTIFDEDDQLSLIKKVMADLEIDTKSFNPKIILYKISELKTQLIFPENYEPKNFYPEIVAKVYKKYQQELKDHNAVDFDDLIVLPIKIFTAETTTTETRNKMEKSEKTENSTLRKYQEWWKYILVDEYQDTSYDQYIFINLLAQKYRNLFAIGDDAQSIYQFRRADIRNILNFQKDYPEAKIVLLEQNYRSTKNIITAAQEIISKNKNQIQKALWTENDHGEKIPIVETMNERHEAGFVISKIEELMSKGNTAKDFAILYRTHAQSRALEETLIMSGYPYQIVGGLKFYERKEIKDILAYLKLIANPADSLALERIYNVPTRGIGPALLGKLKIKNEKLKIYEPDLKILKTLEEILKDKDLPLRQLTATSEFHKILTDITLAAEKKNLREIIKYIIKKIKYEDYLKEFSLAKQNDYENFEDRLENLKELQTVASKYDELEGKVGIERFLEEVTLFQHTDKLRNNPNKITLMTIHASKGLEFPVIFIVGMEEGLFPHSRTVINPSELEEERRLCYVAITRAKQHLILTYTKFRNIFGSYSTNLPSRFIGDIPTELADWQMIDGYDEEETIHY